MDHKGTKFYAFDTNGKPSYRVVLSAHDFEAFVVDWHGPGKQRALQRAMPNRPLLGVQAQPPQSLFRIASQNAFWRLSKSQLQHIMRQESLPVETTLQECL
eukprot:944332-Amphidinium_carterae.1